MGFEKLVTVFECSSLTYSTLNSTIKYFLWFSSSWVIIFYCIISFIKLEAVLECPDMPQDNSAQTRTLRA